MPPPAPTAPPYGCDSGKGVFQEATDLDRVCWCSSCDRPGHLTGTTCRFQFVCSTDARTREGKPRNQSCALLLQSVNKHPRPAGSCCVIQYVCLTTTCRIAWAGGFPSNPEQFLAACGLLSGVATHLETAACRADHCSWSNTPGRKVSHCNPPSPACKARKGIQRPRCVMVGWMKQ